MTLLDWLSQIGQASPRDQTWDIQRLAKLASKQDRADQYVQLLAMRLPGFDSERDTKRITTWITETAEHIWRLPQGTPVFKRRFFADLYSWLYACRDDSALTMKVLTVTSEVLKTYANEKYESLKQHQQFCDNLTAIIQCDNMVDCPTDARKHLNTYRKITDTLRKKGSDTVGIEMADVEHLYDFARRLKLLLDDKTIREARRDFGSCPLPAIEEAHGFLDRLSAPKPPPLNYMTRVLNRNNWEGALGLTRLPLAERKLCEWLLDKLRNSLRVTSTTPTLSLYVDGPITETDSLKIAIQAWNTGTDTLTSSLSYGFRTNLQARSNYNKETSLNLEKFEVTLRDISGLDKCKQQCLCYLDIKVGDRVLEPFVIAPGMQRCPAKNISENVEIPNFDMRSSDANRQWLVDREKLLDRVLEPLADPEKLGAGSARWLCGLPRSGKTSLLRLIKHRAEKDGISVSYADLQRLVPLLPKMDDIQRDTWIRGFLRDILKDLSANCIARYEALCAGGNYINALAAYQNVLRELAKEKPRLILMDEFGEVLRDLEKHDLESLEALVRGLGIDLKSQFPELPVHFIICVDDSFFAYSSTHWAYHLLSSLDPQPLYVGQLTREEMRTLLHLPFAACSSEVEDGRFFDDRAETYLETYTGGQPLLLQLISRDLARLVKAGALSPPFNHVDMYRLLQAPLSQDESDFYLYATRLRDALARAAQLIWDSLSGETKRRLEQVLALSTMNYVNDLEAIGLVHLMPNGKPNLSGELINTVQSH